MSDLQTARRPTFDRALRITLVISSLGAGGAERVIVFIANYWAAHGHQVTLVTFSGAGAVSFFDVSPGVVRLHLDVPRARWKLMGVKAIRQVAALRRGIQQSNPDVVISFLTKVNIMTILACRGLGVPVVVSDRQDPKTHPLDPVRRVFRRILYPRATHVVAQTQAALAFFPDDVQRRARVIPNPVPVPPAAGWHARRSSGRKAVAIGRLDDQKGFDLLLRAFVIAHKAHPDWTLDIWGEGRERPRLEQLVARLALDPSVRLPGFTTSPYDVLRSADLFVLSSRREGFPNALCEAMACGVAVISFDCPSGPSEIITDGVDGVLVPPENVERLAEAMDRLMSRDDERLRLGSRAVEVRERFSATRVMARWDAVVGDSLPQASR